MEVTMLGNEDFEFEGWWTDLKRGASNIVSDTGDFVSDMSSDPTGTLSRISSKIGSGTMDFLRETSLKIMRPIVRELKGKYGEDARKAIKASAIGTAMITIEGALAGSGNLPAALAWPAAGGAVTDWAFDKIWEELRQTGGDIVSSLSKNEVSMATYTSSAKSVTELMQNAIDRSKTIKAAVKGPAYVGTGAMVSKTSDAAKASKAGAGDAVKVAIPLAALWWFLK